MTKQMGHGRQPACKLLSVGLASAAIVFSASAAHANGSTSAEQSVTISANVPKICAIDTPFDNITIETNSQGRLDTAPVSPAPQASVTCNVPATVDLSSQHGAMVNTGVYVVGTPQLPAGFAASFDYTATVKDSGGTDLVTYDSGADTGVDQPESITGSTTMGSTASGTDETLTLEVSAVSVAPDVLQSGGYQDILTVKILPAN